nr:hypothetical protein [Burkholderia ubonensis]
MIRAILEGRKTQTRRVVKLPHNNPLGAWESTTVGGHGTRLANGSPAPELPAIWHTRTGDCLVCPHGNARDQLWVRETHEVRRIGTETLDGGRPTRRYAGIAYQADDGRAEVDIDLNTFQALDARQSRGWSPSIHMPRWASRITLEITSVRAERLQSISEPDARAEGVTIEDHHMRGYCAGAFRPPSIRAFHDLWDSLNAARGYGWDTNPWVWVVEFKQIAAPAGE